MKRVLEEDLAGLKELAFRRAERSGPLLEAFHLHKMKINASPNSQLLWRVYDWLRVPFSLWPIDFEGLAKHLLKEIADSGTVDSDIARLADIIGIPPDEKTSNAVAAFEHVVESGDYDHLVRSPEKFEENEATLQDDKELREVWEEIKSRWGTHISRNSRGVVRRRLSQERNIRGDWSFDWADAKKKFELFFDAMCYRWRLYGMENDKPLLLKLSVNPTPHGTMIVIPKHWSLDPRHDLHWSKISKIHRAHGARRQGPKLSRNRIQKQADAKKVELLWNEAREKGHRGDDRYDFVFRKLNMRLDTDHSWVKRHIRIARKNAGPSRIEEPK